MDTKQTDLPLQNHKEEIKAGGLEDARVEVRVSKMSFQNHIRRFFAALFLRLYALFWSEGTDDRNAEDTILETGGGRRERGGSIERHTRHLWDTTAKLQRVAKALRTTIRKKETSGLQSQKEPNTERYAILKRLYESNDFNIVKEILISKESAAYFGLRHPETKKEGLTMDYYNGYLNGRIGVIEEIRDEFDRAVIILQRKSIEEVQKNANTTDQKK